VNKVTYKSSGSGATELVSRKSVDNYVGRIWTEAGISYFDPYAAASNFNQMFVQYLILQNLI
jgi:hypothetical protein